MIPSLRLVLRRQTPVVVTVPFPDTALSPGDHAVSNTSAWACLSEATGEVLPAGRLLEFVRGLDRKDTFLRLARIAAVLANTSGGVFDKEAQAWSRDLLVIRKPEAHPVETLVANYLDRLPTDRAVAHEQVICFLQTLVLAEGADPGTVTTDQFLAFLMLAANDHAHAWVEEGARELTEMEDVVAQTFFVTMFNHTDDPLRVLVRAEMLMDAPPLRGPFATADRWAALQVEAFGRPFADYFASFVTPLFMISRIWGSSELPVVSPASFFSQTLLPGDVGEKWLRDLTTDADEFRTRVLRRPDGLPNIAPALYRKPFVSFGSGNLVASSPTRISDALSLGAWGRLNGAAKTVLGDPDSDAWTKTFGDLFERWCQRLAGEASESHEYRGRLIVPACPGDADEIEDLIFVENATVILGSVKGGVVPERKLRAGRSRADAIDFLERFFFESPEQAKAKRHRGGAVFQLDAKVRKLRAGAYAKAGLSSDLAVIPMIVSFDNVGESGALYKWLEHGCATRHLLEDRCRPLVVVSPLEYEVLVALAARGYSLCELLLEKTSELWRLTPMQVFLHKKVPGSLDFRLPILERRFRELGDRAQEVLFGRKASGPDEPSSLDD